MIFKKTPNKKEKEKLGKLIDINNSALPRDVNKTDMGYVGYFVSRHFPKDSNNLQYGFVIGENPIFTEKEIVQTNKNTHAQRNIKQQTWNLESDNNLYLQVEKELDTGKYKYIGHYLYKNNTGRKIFQYAPIYKFNEEQIEFLENIMPILAKQQEKDLNKPRWRLLIEHYLKI